MMNPQKIIQAAAVVIKAHGGHIGRMRLLKILYIADRERLAECKRPITWDKAVAMERGPVLSKTYDLIKGQDIDTPTWDHFIQRSGPRDVQLMSDPGIDKLSKAEIEKLNEVCEKLDPLDDEDISDLTHEFSEWKDNKPGKGSQNPIPFEARLLAVGFTKEDADKIASDHRDDMMFEKLIAGNLKS